MQVQYGSPLPHRDIDAIENVQQQAARFGTNNYLFYQDNQVLVNSDFQLFGMWAGFVECIGCLLL